jgi:hypothetical protein
MHRAYTANGDGRNSHSSATSNIDAAEQFREVAAQGGLIIEHLVADGEIHRCDVEGNGGKGDGAYCLHLDGIPAGWFQNHRDGAGVRRWHARTRQKLTEAEVAAHKAKVRVRKAQREAELEKEHLKTAERATALVENNPNADDSRLYFVRKNPGAAWCQERQSLPIQTSSQRNSMPLGPCFPYSSHSTLSFGGTIPPSSANRTFAGEPASFAGISYFDKSTL